MDMHESHTTFDETALLQHYDLLKDIGVLNEIEGLKTDVHLQREIIEDALNIFKQQHAEALIEYLISQILNRFVPSYLVFIVKPQPHTSDLEYFTYKNLARTYDEIAIDSLRPFVDFFSRYRQPVSFSLLEHESPDSKALDELRRLETEMLVPILGPGGLMGLIIIGKKLTEGEYTNREITYINRLMQFGSVALQNVINYASASLDQKTRLFNHSYFMNRLEQELRRYKRYDRAFSVLMCDLDHFKLVNDTYGHPAGDQILVDFSRILEESTRSVDVVARYGGEEFIVLLTETTRVGAWRTAERIRRAAEVRDFRYEDMQISVTCSIGACHVASIPTANASDIVQIADAALYWAKENGRNRSSLYRAGLYFMSRHYY
jgi:diguanylate cyclase (GGDEF)-like protein